MPAANTPHPLGGANETEPGRRAVLRGISAMSLAAFTLPMARANAEETAEIAPEAPRSPAPKPKPKLVKASNTPLAATTDIPPNSGMLFEADEYIVTQPKPGKFVGFDSLCTHEGCPVDSFATPGEMDCSCHGARYSLVDGKVLSGPTKKPLPKKPIIVENGHVYKAKPAK